MTGRIIAAQGAIANPQTQTTRAEEVRSHRDSTLDNPNPLQHQQLGQSETLEQGA
ncbi:hypothetical protein PN441_02555 [Spirulina major CS-329]|uniref:hypothetical protein n=1 Tax=Spirulina TaxID=1154 RepID=UPI00232B6963|nr:MULTISPECIES: hypothetical protein [Spirulina]MDB9495391.1 hypothetical protein [Spirulina subsalsa CS-330]MDB9501936.1 hypothetical protein [Spirulina major CS-329]